MADIIDRAQDQTNIWTQRQIEAHSNKLRWQARQPSAEYCEQCGEEIPETRRVAIPGVQLCVTCQTYADDGR